MNLNTAIYLRKLAKKEERVNKEAGHDKAALKSQLVVV